MKIMKLALLSVAIMSVNATYAGYLVRVNLEPNHISLEDYDVEGSISLTKPTINRGQASAITWTYTYANEININGVGNYTEKSSTIVVDPLVSTTYTINIKNGSKTKVEHLNLTVIQPVQDITFDADTYKIGYGQSAKLNWNVLNTSGVSISSLGPQSDSGLFSVSPLNTTTYTLTANGYDGVSAQTKSLDIVVVPNAVIQSLTVDKPSVTKGDSVNFSWNVTNPEGITFNGESLGKTATTKSLVMNTVGSSNYKLDVDSFSGTKVSDTVSVNVIDTPVVGTINKPATNVFANAAYATSWTGTGVSSYKLSSNNAASGVPVAGVNLNSSTSYSITPTAAGTYTYTVTGTNALNATNSNTFSMTVEADPTLGGFLVNGSTAISVTTNAALSFTSSGLSAGAAFQGRSGASDVALPGAASAGAGTSTYYAAAKKTLNGITRYSANRAVTVTTVAPGPVCEDSWGYSYWNETEYEGSGYELSVYWRGVAKYSGYRSQSGGSLVGNDGKTYARYGDYGVCKMN